MSTPGAGPAPVHSTDHYAGPSAIYNVPAHSELFNLERVRRWQARVFQFLARLGYLRFERPRKRRRGQSRRNLYLQWVGNVRLRSSCHQDSLPAAVGSRKWHRTLRVSGLSNFRSDAIFDKRIRHFNGTDGRSEPARFGDIRQKLQMGLARWHLAVRRQDSQFARLSKCNFAGVGSERQFFDESVFERLQELGLLRWQLQHGTGDQLRQTQ